MARKRYSDEDVLKLLREIDVHLHDGLDVVESYQIKATLINHKLFVCLLSSRPHRQFFVHLGTLQ